MSGAALAPAVVGGCIGIGGAAVGATIGSVLTTRRDSRTAAVELADRILGVDSLMWSPEPKEGRELIASLRQLVALLDAAGVEPRLSRALSSLSYSIWREVASNRGGVPQASLDRLTLRNDVERVVIASVLPDRHWIRRRREVKVLLNQLEGQSLPIPPGHHLTHGNPDRTAGARSGKLS